MNEELENEKAIKQRKKLIGRYSIDRLAYFAINKVHMFTCIDCSILTNPIGDQAETFYCIRPSHKSFTYTAMEKGKENIFCVFVCYDNHQNKTHFSFFKWYS